MNFNEVLTQTIAMLRAHGRVSYRALQRQFGIEDDLLNDLQDEFIAVQQVAIEQDGRMLVWMGATVPPFTAAPVSATSTPAPPPTATPTAQALGGPMVPTASEAERRQLTVMLSVQARPDPGRRL